MHNFAFGTVGKSRSKRGGVIKVNPPSLARRTFKVPGKGPAPIGRPIMNRAGQTQLFVTDNEDIFAKSNKVFRPQLKKPHNLAKTVESNVPQTDIRNSSLFHKCSAINQIHTWRKIILLPFSLTILNC